jgi:c-di-GMP-binding flagellar brake protein YcgR
MNSFKDKRQHERIFFSEENQILVFLSLSNADEKTLTANILNISKGGLCLAFKDGDSHLFQIGSRLIMKGGKEGSSLQDISGIEMEIKWIYDGNALEHIGIGCKFINPPESFKAVVRQLIDAESANV